MKTYVTFLAAIAVLGLAAGTTAAHADYIFSGSGLSGNFAGQASEPWFVNFDSPTNPSTDWGSPGVNNGTTPYLEADTAFGMDLNFFGTGLGVIDSASITLGNAAGCAGTSSGGTTFCTISPVFIWDAVLNGDHSISFRAADPSAFLVNGQFYFVNVFFEGQTVPEDFGFNGAWLTVSAGVPEPATFSLFAAGLGVMGWLRRRKKRRCGS